MSEKIVAFSTCGSEDEARRLAQGLVESRLAACVNIVPGVRSVYRWKGAIEEESEWMLVIKSSRSLFGRLEEELRRLHSYEVPELIAFPVVEGSPAYMSWLDRELLDRPSALSLNPGHPEK